MTILNLPIEPLEFFIQFVVVATFVGAAVIVIRDRLVRVTKDNYKEAGESWEVRVKALEDEVKTLKSRIDVVETIPLRQIASDYHTMVDTLNLMAKNIQSLNKLMEKHMEDEENVKN